MAATFKGYDVPPGPQKLPFSTGAHPPLQNAKFVFGGNPATLTKAIEGANGSPVVTFDPPATPFEVTIFFVQNPMTSDSGDFMISVDNSTDHEQKIEIGMIYAY